MDMFLDTESELVRVLDLPAKQHGPSGLRFESYSLLHIRPGFISDDINQALQVSNVH